MTGDQLGQRGPLAPAEPGQERFHHRPDGVVGRVRRVGSLIARPRSGPRERGEDVLETLQRPDVTLRGRRFAEPEHSGAFAVGELLEMAEDEDLAVDGIHRVERLLQPQLPLGPDGHLAGPGVAAQELRRDRGRGRRGRGRAVDRDLPARVPRPRPEVPAMARSGAAGA